MRPIPSFLSKVACLTIVSVVVGSCTTSADPIPVYSIALQPQLDSIEVGQTFDSWLVVLQDAAGNTLTGRTLRWESSNEAVATIDANTGAVTGLLSGQTIVNVRADGKTAAATIKVVPPILSIVVTPDSMDVPLTTSRQIGAQLVGPSGVAITNRTITWLSENPGIAVVSAQGLVTAVSQGTTTIVLRAGTKQASVRVRVVGEPAASVRITPPQSVQIIRLGQSKQLTAECLNASNQVLTGRTILWNSSSPLVASVSQSGLVTGNGLGVATIDARCDNAVATMNAQVTLVPVTSVSIAPTSLALHPGNVGQLTATARDSAGNVLSLQGRSVTWSSSNIPVANVQPQGVVTAHSVGIADITVNVDGVTSDPVPVTVTNPTAMIDVGGYRELPITRLAMRLRSPDYTDKPMIKDPRSFAGWFDSSRR
jgi:uncharacterized protein YjdB